MNTHPSRAIGFRSTQPFGNDTRGIGWRFANSPSGAVFEKEHGK